MRIHKQKIELKSAVQTEFIDITDAVQEVVDNSGIRDGQVLVYAEHTTMGVAINHNEPMLLQDFSMILSKIAPVDSQYSHDLFELKKANQSDGRSNGHSHCKSIILGNNETIPVTKGKLILSPIQSIFAVEFDGPRKREILLQITGE